MLAVPGDRLLNSQPADLDQEVQLYSGLVITDAAAGLKVAAHTPASPQPDGLDRVEALDPRTLRPVWFGPWTGDSLEILPGLPTPPHLVIAVSCAPDGISKTGLICTKARLFAINS